MNDKCHCGRPLHYNDHHLKEAMCRLVEVCGEFVPVVQASSGRVFNVQRHYIALHGIVAAELHTYGFEEITDVQDRRHG